MNELANGVVPVKNKKTSANIHWGPSAKKALMEAMAPEVETKQIWMPRPHNRFPLLLSVRNPLRGGDAGGKSNAPNVLRSAPCTRPFRPQTTHYSPQTRNCLYT